MVICWLLVLSMDLCESGPFSLTKGKQSASNLRKESKMYVGVVTAPYFSLEEWILMSMLLILNQGSASIRTNIMSRLWI